MGISGIVEVSSNCTDYIDCTNGAQYACPCDQTFHPANQQCVPHKHGYYLADPTRCSATYWRCHEGTRTSYECYPNTLVYNLWSAGPASTCEFTYNVPRCSDGGWRPCYSCGIQWTQISHGAVSLKFRSSVFSTNLTSFRANFSRKSFITQAQLFWYRTFS